MLLQMVLSHAFYGQVIYHCIHHHIFFLIYIYIYLFICLCCIFVAACLIFVGICGIQFLDQELNLGPLHWECRDLATGSPGKFLPFILKHTHSANLKNKSYLVNAKKIKKKKKNQNVFLPYNVCFS